MLRAFSRCRRLPLYRHSSGSTRGLSPTEYARLTELTDELVDTAALHEPPAGWTSIHSQEKRLANLIKTRQSARTLSLDKAAFDAEGASENDDADTDPFVPGTFVELRRNEISALGVVLGEVTLDSEVHVATLMSTGEVWDPLRSDIMFAVPGLVPAELAERCSSVEIARDPKELNARIKVLQSIREVEGEIDGAMKEMYRRGIGIYGVVKSSDPHAWASTTVAEVARLSSPTPTLVETFAMHKRLLAESEHFEVADGYLIAQKVHVRPQAHVRTIRKVKEWMRQPNGPIQSFASRARPVVAANRRLHAETRYDLPSSRPAQHEWTAEDKEILNFLHRALQPRRSIQEDPYALGRNAILRELNPTTIVQDHTLHEALVDLGMYAPWQDVVSLRDGLNLEHRDTGTSPQGRAVEAIVQRSLSAPAQSGPLGAEDLYRTDPLDHLRHDFGDMPVYVIDGADAKELDDGISVEAVAGEPNSYWLHVHIADPASTLPPTHTLSRLAAEQSESVYFSHRSWPLFPSSLTKSGLMGFSLTPGQENRVLTFSSKVDAAGELVESVVRPGIARNLIKLTYEQVTIALTGSSSPVTFPLSLPPPPPQYIPPSDSQVADLRILDMIRMRVVARKLRLGIIEVDNGVADITNFATPEGINSPTTKPTEFLGFPTFDYRVMRVSEVFASGAGIVAEAMKLACRTASRWCVERGVDVIRRAAKPLQATPSAMERLLAMRDSRGFVDSGAITALSMNPPSAKYTLLPSAHWSMGVPEGEGYARTTSPLRRFGDLLAHYQIHRALLNEKPFFSHEQVNDYKIFLGYTDRVKKRAATLHIRFWSLVALKRYLAAPRPADVPDPLVDLQAKLLNRVRVNILESTLQSPVDIPALGIPATLVGVTKEMNANWQVGGTMRVSVKDIQLGVRPMLYVTPKSTVIE
ncbi:hypothetical protein C8F01DRAFT_658285 [Mycena amicta]|nr:hypothetical protein C8F01DRAFT_658285 [Mycena amicta]